MFRSTVSFNALSNSKTFSFGPLTDISIYVGADGKKNTAFAPRKRNVVAGLQFEFGLAGGGLLNVAPVFYQEWNHNGIAAQFLAAGKCTPAICKENITFDSTFTLEANYLVPLNFLGPVRFASYIQVTAPKGLDGFGHQTTAELHTDNRLILDASSHQPLDHRHGLIRPRSRSARGCRRRPTPFRIRAFLATS